MIMNTRDKEITDQPRLNHFDLKSKSTCNIYTRKIYISSKLKKFKVQLLLFLCRHEDMSLLRLFSD